MNVAPLVSVILVNVVVGIVTSGLISIVYESYRNHANRSENRPASHQLVTVSHLRLFKDCVDHKGEINDEHCQNTELTKLKASEVEGTGSSTEALISARAALEMKLQGKIDKARKLFEHALYLAPNHPEVLLHYGEFLEESDVIQADSMYTRALINNPSHMKAMKNRGRTLPQVEELDRLKLSRIDFKRDLLMSIPDHNQALMRVKKEAYYQYIYHTVGIEGNTMTLGQTRSILETRIAVGGKSIVEHNEILGMDAALKYINATLIHRIGSITLEDILEIHKRVMGHVDPLTSGYMRRTQVYIGEHIPPAPDDIDVLMGEFVLWLNSHHALQLHPIKYAALAHYKLVYIHPFLDGNGRTSRLLLNFILMQAGFPPVIVRKEDRQEYYDVLETGNKGDIRPFVRFIADCSDRTLDFYLWATSEYPSKEVPALAQDGRTIILE